MPTGGLTGPDPLMTLMKCAADFAAKCPPGCGKPECALYAPCARQLQHSAVVECYPDLLSCQTWMKSHMGSHHGGHHSHHSHHHGEHGRGGEHGHGGEHGYHHGHGQMCGMGFVRKCFGYKSQHAQLGSRCALSLKMVDDRAAWLPKTETTSVVPTSEPNKSFFQYRWMWGAEPTTDPDLWKYKSSFGGEEKHHHFGHGWAWLPILIVSLLLLKCCLVGCCVLRARRKRRLRQLASQNPPAALRPASGGIPSVHELPYTALGRSDHSAVEIQMPSAPLATRVVSVVRPDHIRHIPIATHVQYN